MTIIINIIFLAFIVKLLGFVYDEMKWKQDQKRKKEFY